MRLNLTSKTVSQVFISLCNIALEGFPAARAWTSVVLHWHPVVCMVSAVSYKRMNESLHRCVWLFFLKPDLISTHPKLCCYENQDVLRSGFVVFLLGCLAPVLHLLGKLEIISHSAGKLSVSHSLATTTAATTEW